MPQLNTMKIEDRPQKILVYGPPKVGKSLLVGKLAEYGYKLFWFDGENGADVLFQLSPEAQSRVKLFSIADLKTDPQFAKVGNEYMMKKDFSICHEHGVLNCVMCKAKGKPVDQFKWDEVLSDPKAVVVFDSLSQMVTSIQNHVTRADKFDDFGALDKDSKREWGHYMAQKLFLDSFLTVIENSRCKTVVITHETELDSEKNPNAKPVQPLGGTTTQSKSVSKYFGHVVHCRLRSNQHTTISGTTSDNSTQAGSRLNITLAQEAKGLAAIFEYSGNSVKPLVVEDSIIEVSAQAVDKATNQEAATSDLDAIKAKLLANKK